MLTQELKINSVAMDKAYDEFRNKNREVDLYIASGEYKLEAPFIMKHKVSAYGGFDENIGWLRHPIYSSSFLLPDIAISNGLDRNWYNHMNPLFHDTRRPRSN
jgi:hypothetical protein